MKRRRSARLSAVARIFSTASLPLLTIAAAGRQQPFQPAETAAVYRRQQSGCLTNFYSCANQGSAFNGVCCEIGQSCALDVNNQPACCPAK